MKLYKPVLIETAEQAEALPVGTVATHAAGAGMDHAHKVGLDDHLVRGWLSLSSDVSDAAMVGWTALVPIEAEEEVEPASHVAGKLTSSGIEFTEDTGAVATWQRRFVTPWVEDAPAVDVETHTVTWGEA